MSPRLKPPDVEAELVTLLGTAAVPASTRVPAVRPAKFVRVSRAGGTRRNLIQDWPLTIIECWADSSVDAFEVAQAAWATIDGEYREDASLSSPVWNPDSASEQARYQFTVNLFIPLEAS